MTVEDFIVEENDNNDVVDTTEVLVICQFKSEHKQHYFDLADIQPMS